MRRRSRGLRRRLRKHRLALALSGMVLFLLFVPSLFFGRVLSPNDVIYQHYPWRAFHAGSAQNPILNDAPSSWLAHWSLMKDDPASFHWIRYVGGGLPGWGSAGGAVLSPVVFVPVLLLPLILAYSGIIAAKLVVAWALAYGWLREERLGKSGAAIGAAVFATAGVYSVWWLWQSTNATVFYPALLWIVARAFHGKRTPFVAVVATALAIGLSGYPSTTLYGAWVAVAYAIWLAIRTRSVPLREVARFAAAALVALLLAAPFLAPFAAFLERSGYLEGRSTVASAGLGTFPAGHLLGFLNPYRLGDPAEKRWAGDPELGISNNFVESTIYLGIATLVLVAAGIARRHRSRLFWIGLSVALLVVIFGASETLVDAAGRIPGIRYSPVARLRYLLPLPAAFLAASGIRLIEGWMRRASLRRARVATVWVAGAVVAIELAIFAVRFYPYIRPELATIPSTPSIDFLRRQEGPARIAPFFDYLWPNTAELMRVEDIRSHFGSEARWRAILERFAPGSFGGSGTVIQFNGLTFDLTDPLVSALNVRWFVEQPPIDILRWRVMDRSEISETLAGSTPLRPGAPLTIQVDVVEGMTAVDLNIDAIDPKSAAGAVTVELVRPETGGRLWARRISAHELRRSPKLYVPVQPWAAPGNALLVRVTAFDLEGTMPRGESGGVAYGRVRSPVILSTVLPDGRIFENLDVLPRFYAVWRMRRMPFEAMLADESIDYRTEAVLTGSDAPEELTALGDVPLGRRRATLQIAEWTSARAVIRTDAAVPFLLVGSEKITPELRVTLDGENIRPLEVNGMFAAVPVPAGRHTVELERRVGRGWWPLALIGGVAFAAGALLDRRYARPKGAGEKPGGTREARCSRIGRVLVIRAAAAARESRG
ncbi:MAG: hypothetical protein ACRD2J_06580, partial [Thermoanaerobaculia bacterium]